MSRHSVRVVVAGLLCLTCLATTGCAGEYGGMTASARCDNLDALVLMAQAVPTAELVPCVVAGVHEGSGWYLPNLRVHSGSAAFSYVYGQAAGGEAVEVSLVAECDVSDATEIPSDEDDARRFERVVLEGERYAGSRFYTFEGGCVVYDFDLSEEGRSRLISDITLALSLRSRKSLARELADRSNGRVTDL